MTSRPELSSAAASPPAATLEVLATAPITARGFLANASNHTLLVQLEDDDAAGGVVHAVYKPRAGERPLWDFPEGTLHRREVAAFEVSRFLGWDVVPPTVLRDGPHGPGSVQLFVVHDPQRHYFTLVEEPGWSPQLARIAYFDLLVNNADRKGSHILVDEGSAAPGTERVAGSRLVGIDHGLTFHEAPKLRTVVWDLGQAPVADGWRADVARLHSALAPAAHEPLARRLGALLAPAEISALRERAAGLRELRRLPVVPFDRRPYPWPPL